MPDTFDLTEQSQRRYNPLTREWVLVSPHRAKRPWQGQVETTSAAQPPQYDLSCYLCPGNGRANGEHNPAYPHTYAFDNDFPALLSNLSPGTYQPHPLIYAQTERGVCRVLCFSPRHDLTLAQMDGPAIRLVVDAWAQQFAELGALPFIDYVQIFENRGAMMGASNPHPHGQIWASEHLPQLVTLEDAAQLDYYNTHTSTLLSDYLTAEQRLGERIVAENEHFAALVPFWAVWPYETLLISKVPVAAVTDLTDAARDGFADMLRQVTARYDNMFQVSFPYSMGIHQRPTDGKDHPYWHLHVHFYPPLLRSSTVRKFMVGYEMLGTPQRDITPEMAAARLRDLSIVHYLQR